MKLFVPVLSLVLLMCILLQFSLEFPRPTFSVTISSWPSDSLVGEEVYLKLEVRKTGPAGFCDIVYYVDGRKHEKSFYVRGDLRYFYFPLTFQDEGYHTVGLENDEREFYIREPEEALEDADVEIRGFEITPSDVKLRETLYIGVSLKNNSDLPTWKTVRLWVDNDVYEKRVLVKGSEKKTVWYSLVLNKPSIKIRVENCPQPEQTFSLGFNPLQW